MMNFLKNHPFAVEAFFENSTVLTFAVPIDQLKDLIAEPLALDTFDDQWGFIAIAMVQTKELRPKGFPKFMGNKFFLIGYRIFVRYRNQAGKNLRGLYILQSQTDKLKMQYLGNIFTHYNYSTTDISIEKSANKTSITSEKSRFHVVFESDCPNVKLPDSSPFSDWKQARKFAGPLPHTFTVHAKNKNILTILGRRKNWKPRPVQVHDYSFDFLDRLNLKGAVLANAFEIQNVDYHWEKGKLEHWG